VLDSITPVANHFKEAAIVIAIVVIGLLTLVEFIIVAVIIKTAFVKHVYDIEFGRRKTKVAQGHDIMETTPSRYIKASELKSFDFCERAWSFERNGPLSTLAARRAEDERGQKTHVGIALRSRTALHIAGGMFLSGFVGLAVGLALWMTHR
jgi:hypothetical protein